MKSLRHPLCTQCTYSTVYRSSHQIPTCSMTQDLNISFRSLNGCNAYPLTSPPQVCQHTCHSHAIINTCVHPGMPGLALCITAVALLAWPTPDKAPWAISKQYESYVYCVITFKHIISYSYRGTGEHMIRR